MIGNNEISSNTNITSRSRLGSIVHFMVVLNPQGPRFDPGLANYVSWTTFPDNLCSSCEDKQKHTNY